MNQTVRKVLLVVIMSLIILLLLLGASYAFFAEEVPVAVESPVVVSSCAGVKFSDNDTNSINLTNTIPMSEIKGMQTTPYSFTVSTNCDSLVGFNLYFVPIEGNTIDVSKIRYAITSYGSKDILKTGLVSELSDSASEFTTEELNQIKTSLNSNYLSINKSFQGDIPFKGSIKYDLYMWIDEAAGNEVMDKTFSMAVTIKSIDRDEVAFEMISNLYNTKLLAGKSVDDIYTETGLYYHTGSLENSAEDNSFRYAGSNPNNYVCFKDTCTEEELFRIIGVFQDRLKIIKYTSIGEKTWSTGTDNSWYTSSLNAELNGVYLQSLTFKDFIDTTSWKVGSCAYASCRDNVLPKTLYQNEIINNDPTKVYDGKIGLIYLSDLVYGSSKNMWSKPLYNTTSLLEPYEDYRNANDRLNNWLFKYPVEWTITPIEDNSHGVYESSNYGNFYSSTITENGQVLPVFYLKNNVKITSGTGSQNNPYIIK